MLCCLLVVFVILAIAYYDIPKVTELWGDNTGGLEVIRPQVTLKMNVWDQKYDWKKCLSCLPSR